MFEFRAYHSLYTGSFIKISKVLCKNVLDHFWNKLWLFGGFSGPMSSEKQNLIK